MLRKIRVYKLVVMVIIFLSVTALIELAKIGTLQHTNVPYIAGLSILIAVLAQCNVRKLSKQVN